MIESGAFAGTHVEQFMENLPEDKQDKPDKPEEGSQTGDRQQGSAESLSQPDVPPNEADEGIPVSEETHGNRVEEKIENRARKKQETHEEAKSITGTEAHHDARNEHPDSGPAPLDRY
jgi:hypothetical protein